MGYGKRLLGDCLELMPTLESGSVDMILCDLPYGTTACKWDTIIPFEPLWTQYKRLIKDNGAIVLTASQPFTSALVMSNPTMFKYEWVWRKSRPTNYLHAKTAPLREHENVLFFCKGVCAYYPQGVIPTRVKNGRKNKSGANGGVYNKVNGEDYIQTLGNYPRTILTIASQNEYLHPTQKPVTLFEYLIRTYTNEGETVLDNCAGSFTTAIACINTNRRYICIEKDPDYFRIGSERIKNHLISLGKIEGDFNHAGR